MSFVDPLLDQVGYQLRRASLAMMTDLTLALAPLGLKPSEASALLMISANPGLTQSALGRHLGIQRANMAPLTAGLAARGLIARTPMDGRSQGVELTDTGQATADAVRSTVADHEGRFTNGLSADQRAALLSVLAHVQAADEAA